MWYTFNNSRLRRPRMIIVHIHLKSFLWLWFSKTFVCSTHFMYYFNSSLDWLTNFRLQQHRILGAVVNAWKQARVTRLSEGKNICVFQPKALVPKPMRIHKVNPDNIQYYPVVETVWVGDVFLSCRSTTCRYLITDVSMHKLGNH